MQQLCSLLENKIAIHLSAWDKWGVQRFKTCCSSKIEKVTENSNVASYHDYFPVSIIGGNFPPQCNHCCISFGVSSKHCFEARNERIKSRQSIIATGKVTACHSLHLIHINLHALRKPILWQTYFFSGGQETDFEPTTLLEENETRRGNKPCSLQGYASNQRRRDVGWVLTAIRRQLDTQAELQITLVSSNYKQKRALIVKAPLNILGVPF